MLPNPLLDIEVTGNGVRPGDVAENIHGDPQFFAYHRPFLMEGGPYDGKPCVVVNARDPKTGKYLTTNEKGERVPYRRAIPVVDAIFKHGLRVPMWAVNATSMRRDDWIQVQDAVVDPYRERLKFLSVLQSRVSVPGGGFGALTYEYDAMSDAHEAVIDMDLITEPRGDAPHYLPRSAPLPFVQSGFYYTARQIAASKMKGRPGADVISAEQAGRRIAELSEDAAIGNVTGPTFGTRTGYFAHDLTSTWFGVTNYTNRNIKTDFTAPTAGGWVPDTTYNEILTALSTLYDDRVYGPFAIFYSTDWTQYMHRVYSLSGGNTPGETLRTMLLKHEDIESVERLDRLTSTFTLLIIALDRKYILYVNNVGLRTWQWKTEGDQQENFRVGVSHVTIPMSDFVGRSGTLHGTTT